MIKNIPEPKFYGTFWHGYGPPNHARWRIGICPLNNVCIDSERFNLLKIGDVIHRVWYNRYQHGATMIITKINKKSIHAIEIKGSYGAGTVWHIHKETKDSYRLDVFHTSDERLDELSRIW